MISNWKAVIITLFPEMFPGPLQTSVVGNALNKGLWECNTVPMRDFGVGKHSQVDDTPAGGGAGMVLRADVVSNALDHTHQTYGALPTYYLSARGAPFTQSKARELADEKGVILLCGRFEGVDERLLKARQIEELSIGDFVLSGGEIAAFSVIDAVVRLLPGVLGGKASLFEESFENDLLEYPQYTRPRVWEDHRIPDVLLEGDHKKIAQWRRQQAKDLTQSRRPDLWQRYVQNSLKSDD
ncbi:MAG: tRNA (guanosine(37)-N1)-methyltransferase TrmD [Pseudomonadota bacterium]